MGLNFIDSTTINFNDILIDLGSEEECTSFNKRNVINIPILNPKGYKSFRRYYKNNNKIMLYLIILLQVSSKLPRLIKRFKGLYIKTLIKNSRLILIESDNKVTHIVYNILKLKGIKCYILKEETTKLNSCEGLKI